MSWRGTLLLSGNWMHGLCVFFCQLASRYFELSIDKCFWSFVLVPRTCVACSASQVDFMFVQVSSHLHIPVVVVLLALLSSVCSHLASHLGWRQHWCMMWVDCRCRWLLHSFMCPSVGLHLVTLTFAVTIAFRHSCWLHAHVSQAVHHKLTSCLCR